MPCLVLPVHRQSPNIWMLTFIIKRHFPALLLLEINCCLRFSLFLCCIHFLFVSQSLCFNFCDEFLDDHVKVFFEKCRGGWFVDMHEGGGNVEYFLGFGFLIRRKKVDYKAPQGCQRLAKKLTAFAFDLIDVDTLICFASL